MTNAINPSSVSDIFFPFQILQRGATTLVQYTHSCSIGIINPIGAETETFQGT